MNKIYKVIFYQTKQILIAVYECARGHGKCRNTSHHRSSSGRSVVSSKFFLIAACLTGIGSVNARLYVNANNDGRCATHNASNNPNRAETFSNVGNVSATNNECTPNDADTQTDRVLIWDGGNATFGGEVYINGESKINGDLSIKNGVTIDMGNNTIGNIADGINARDAVNKAQLDAVANIADRQTYFHANDSDSSNDTNINTTNYGSVDDTAGAQGINSVAAGAGARATGEKGVAVGNDARATGEDGYALGSGSRARGENSIALGTGSSAGASTGSATAKVDTIAIGNNTQAYASQAITMGSDIRTSGDYGIAIGSNTASRKVDSTGYAGVAIGSGGANTGAMANGESAVAIGGGNSDSSGLDGAFAAVKNGVAIGTGTVANSNEGDVALGANSITAAANTGDYTLNSSYTAAATTANSVVSVGSSNNERQIQNVAAGVIGANSTDAINGSQLHATNDYLTNLSTTTATNMGGDAAVDNTGNITFTNIGNTGENTIDNAIAASQEAVTSTNGSIIVNDSTANVFDLSVNEAGIDLTYQANGTNQQTVSLKDGLNFENGTNTTVTVGSDGEVEYSLNDDISLNSVILTGAPTADKHATTKQYVDDGRTQVTSSNGSVTISETTSGNATVYDLSIDTSAIERESKKHSSVVAGNNVSISSRNNANGGLEYTVNADKSTVSGGSGLAISVTDIGNDITDYKVTLDQTTQDSLNNANSALQNIVTQVNGSPAKTLDQTDNAANFVNGDNIELSIDNGDIKVSTATDVTFDSITTDSINIDNKINIGSSGIDAGNTIISNIATGIADEDAVNVRQLNDAIRNINITNNTTNALVGDDGNTRKTITNSITNPDGTTTTVTTDNVAIDDEGNPLLITYNVSGQTEYIQNTVVSAVQNMNDQGIKFFHTNDGVAKPIAQSQNSIDSSAAGAYATAVGYQAAANGENALAIGKGSTASGENSIAIGTGNEVKGNNSGAIGDPTVVTGDSAYSIGNNNHIATNSTYALGSNITTTADNSVILGNNSAAVAVHTTENGGNYTYNGRHDTSASGIDNVVGIMSVGNNDETRQIQYVAAGVIAHDSTDAINGSQLYYTNQAIASNASNIGSNASDIIKNRNAINQGLNFIGDNNEAYNFQLGDTVEIIGDNNITTTASSAGIKLSLNDDIDLNSITAGNTFINSEGITITDNETGNTVKLSESGLDNGGQTITDVAAGVVSETSLQAINGSQLYATNQMLIGNSNSIKHLTNELQDLEDKVNQLDDETKAGIASSVAIGMLGQPFEAGKSAVSTGIAAHEGQGALAVGLSSISDNGKWLLKGAMVHDTANQTTVAGSATYSW